MIKDSEKFAEDDKKVKERVKTKNELEASIYSLKKQVNENEKIKAKLSKSDKKRITEAYERKIKWLESNISARVDEFKAQKKELEEIVNPIMSELYENTNGDQLRKQKPDRDEL